MSREEQVLEEFGAELRRAREASGKSIDEIAERTRINRKYIQAIEAGDLAALPPGPYTRAFLKEYAEELDCAVPEELSEISNTAQSKSTSVTSVRIVSRREPRDAPEDRPSGNTSPNPSRASQAFPAAIKATKGTAKFANEAAKSAARSAVRTTEQVIRKVESGAKEAVDALTSKSLWEEAEVVRRERRGHFPPSADESQQGYPPNALKRPSDLDIEEIRSTIYSSESPSPQNGYGPSTIRPTAQEQVILPPIGRRSQPELEEEIESDRPGRSLRSLGIPRSGLFSATNLVILGALSVFALVLFFALRMNNQEKTPEVVAPAQSDLARKTPAETKPPSAGSQSAKPVVTVPNDSLHFSLAAHDPVWISISSDGREPLKAEMKAGETRSFTASKTFVVNLGNQHALEMMFNGQALSHLPTIEHSAVVVKDLVLTRDHISLGGKDVGTGKAVGAAPVRTDSSHAGAHVNHNAVTPVVTTPGVKKAPSLSPSPAKKSPVAAKPSAVAKAAQKEPVKHVPETSHVPNPKTPKKSNRHDTGKKGIKSQIPSVEPQPARP